MMQSCSLCKHFRKLSCKTDERHECFLIVVDLTIANYGLNVLRSDYYKSAVSQARSQGAKRLIGAACNPSNLTD